MENLSFLSLVPLFLAAQLPVAAAVRGMMTQTLTAGWPSDDVRCVPNGTYQVNLRRLAAAVLAEASAARGPSSFYTSRAVGYWPNRVQASSFCPRRHEGDGSGNGSGHSPCAACIAEAFVKVERACPYRREAYFYSRNCTLELGEFRIVGIGAEKIFEGNILKKALASGLMFQAIGIACLFFLLLQEWRSRKRSTMVQSTPLLPGE